MPMSLRVQLLLPLCAALFALRASFPGCMATGQMINGSWHFPKAEEWKSRTIYQLLTDRMGSIKGDQKAHCKNFNKYCGGTYEGIYTHFLDYISGLGFDAIWVSPVSEQTGGPTWMYPEGYHGYWSQNLEKNNDKFGTEADFLLLVEEAHAKGIWVMLDIVPNHMGFVADYNYYYPFNQTSHFHDCGPCFGFSCGYDKNIPTSVTWCRLSELPDLDQNVTFVRDYLINWTLNAIQKFHLDGIRVDAAKHTDAKWLQELTNATSIFSIGEYTSTPQYIADRLNNGALLSSLNFPLESAMRGVFTKGDSISVLLSLYESYFLGMPTFVASLGNFIDNHDVDRFLCVEQDLALFKNALTVLAFYPGIPVLYYGSEQGMMGQRDPLWNHGYTIDSEMYVFIQTLFRFRQSQSIWNSDFTNVYSTSQAVWVFTRGDNIIFINNLGPKDNVNALYQTVIQLPVSYLGVTMNNLMNSVVKLVCQSSSVDNNRHVPCILSHPSGFKSRLPMVFNTQLPSTGLDLADSPKLRSKHTSALYAVTFSFWVATVVGMILLGISVQGGWKDLGNWYSHRKSGAYRASDDDGEASIPISSMNPFGNPTMRSGRHRLFQRSGAIRRRGAPELSPQLSMQGLPPLTGGGIATSSSIGLPSFPTAVGIGSGRATPSGSNYAHFPSRREFLSINRARELIGNQQSSHLSPQASMHTPTTVGADPPRSLSNTSTLNRLLSRPVKQPDPLPVQAVPEISEPSPKQRPPSALAAKAAHLAPQNGGHEAVTVTFERNPVSSVREGLREGLLLHVAMEYTLPQMGYNNEFVYGGLGKVVDVFLKEWPGKIGLCCPMYEDIYESPTAATPKFANGAPPNFSFTVQVNFRPVLVGVYLMDFPKDGFPEDGVTYVLLQADIFRHRKRGTIYTFQDEEEMLTWLSVFNQAVAVILVTFAVQRVQFHDYHGSLSLLYLPLDYHPEVLYVAHNAHYNGTFPIPNKDRRLYVFGMFDLDAFRYSHFCEHKGFFDFIYAVVTYLKMFQKEIGVVAVSPRYADQICSKLSAYWRLRRSSVIGVMNGLPLTNCLASSLEKQDLDFEGALAFKRKAKREFQERFGLTVGDEFSLIIFLGRMTHQKGCDLIALAAPHFLSKCPNAQLVMVGPVGDLMGKEAQENLSEVAPRFPGRVYAPPGKYFSGDEKELLLAAADFCLVPSRFEPCGLVDIELGWNGAIIIGHDTGGLGKMPGVYFKVESSAQKHLVVKLTNACVKACNLGPEQRTAMMKDALERRFDTTVMMDKYEEHWQKIDAAVAEVRVTLDKADKNKAQTHDKFYQDLWKSKNLQELSDEERGEMRGVLFVFRGKVVTKQYISNILMLLMQAYAIIPGVLVMGYIVFVEIATMSIIGCKHMWDASNDWLPDAFLGLDVRVVLFFGIFVIAAPFWVIVMINMKPLHYVRLCTTATFLSMVFVHASILWTQALQIALITAAIVSPSGICLLAVGFMGEDLEVSEVGLGYLTTVEMSLAFSLFLGSILPAFANSQLPFLAVGGVAVLLLGLVACWFWQDDVLTPAYTHMMLSFKGQWRMLASLKMFWITLALSVGDWVQYVIFTYIVLVSWGLSDLMQIYSVTTGVHVAAVFLAFLWLKSRWSQLRVQSWTLALAAAPGLYVIGSAVVGYSTNLWVVFLILAIVELLAGPRRHLLGLLCFQTLPTREIVTLWQMFNVIGGSVVAFLVIITGYSSTGTVPQVKDLMIGVGVIEAIRTILMPLLFLLHHRYNLATL